jgi:hypothetical protein
MAPKRARFKGEADLHAILREFIVSPWWLKYPEKPKDPIKKSIIVAHGDVLRKLRELAPNLSFLSSDVKAALAKIADEQNDWPLLKEEITDWIDKNDKRLRTMCRHTAQALLKKRGEQHWLTMVFNKVDNDQPAKRKKHDAKELQPHKEEPDKEEAEDDESEEDENALPAKRQKDDAKGQQPNKEKPDKEKSYQEAVIEDEDEEEEEEQPGVTEIEEFPEDAEIKAAEVSSKKSDNIKTKASDTVAVEWESAFCRTHHRAWRRLPGGKKDYTNDIFAAESAKPEDMTTARWPDGYEVHLSELNVCEWTEIQKNMGSKRNRCIREWQGALKSGEQLWIAERKDHKVLLVLFQDGKALIYLPACNEEVALKILKDIATEYIEGTLAKETLRDEKNTRYKAATTDPDKPEIKKKPAAARAATPLAVVKPENSSTPSSSSSSPAAAPSTPSNAPAMLSTMMGNPPPETAFELMYS